MLPPKTSVSVVVVNGYHEKSYSQQIDKMHSSIIAVHVLLALGKSQPVYSLNILINHWSTSHNASDFEANIRVLWIRIASSNNLHSKITIAGDVLPFYTVTALVPTYTEVTVLLLWSWSNATLEYPRRYSNRVAVWVLHGNSRVTSQEQHSNFSVGTSAVTV